MCCAEVELVVEKDMTVHMGLMEFCYCVFAEPKHKDSVNQKASRLDSNVFMVTY